MAHLLAVVRHWAAAQPPRSPSPHKTPRISSHPDGVSSSAASVAHLLHTPHTDISDEHATALVDAVRSAIRGAPTLFRVHTEHGARASRQFVQSTDAATRELGAPKTGFGPASEEASWADARAWLARLLLAAAATPSVTDDDALRTAVAAGAVAVRTAKEQRTVAAAAARTAEWITHLVRVDAAHAGTPMPDAVADELVTGATDGKHPLLALQIFTRRAMASGSVYTLTPLATARFGITGVSGRAASREGAANNIATVLRGDLALWRSRTATSGDAQAPSLEELQAAVREHCGTLAAAGAAAMRKARFVLNPQATFQLIATHGD